MDDDSRKILNLTLEIIYLLTGEEYAVVKRSGGHVIGVRPPSGVSEGKCEQKVLELIQKILELLSGRGYLQNVGCRQHPPTAASPGGLSVGDFGGLESSGSSSSCADAGFIGTPRDLLQGPSHLEAPSRPSGSRDPPEAPLPPPTRQIWASVGEKPAQPEGDHAPLKAEPCEDEIVITCVKEEEDSWEDVAVTPSADAPEESEPPVGAEASPGNVYSCLYCQRRFSSFPELSRHEQAHSAEEPATCATCGRGFDSHALLLAHQKLHGGERPWACEECGKGFFRRARLEVHRRRHTGERPFACGQCGRGFSCKAHLATHLKIHAGVKPYQCPRCGKRFIRKPDLVIHERTHTGERPFACAQCGKRFVCNSHLASHQRVHRDRPACPRCGRSYRSEAALRQHACAARSTWPRPCGAEQEGGNRSTPGDSGL